MKFSSVLRTPVTNDLVLSPPSWQAGSCRRKIIPDKLNRQGRLYSRLMQYGSETELHSTATNLGRFLNNRELVENHEDVSSGGLSIWSGHLCLHIVAYGSQAPIFLQNLGDRDTLYFYYVSKGWLLYPWERLCKTGKRQGEDLHLKGAKKELTFFIKFLK